MPNSYATSQCRNILHTFAKTIDSMGKSPIRGYWLP